MKTLSSYLIQCFESGLIPVGQCRRWVVWTEKQQIQGLDFSYVLPPVQIETQDDNEFFDLSFLDLQNWDNGMQWMHVDFFICLNPIVTLYTF